MSVEKLQAELRDILDDINSGRIKPNTEEYAKATIRRKELREAIRNGGEDEQETKAQPKTTEPEKEGIHNPKKNDNR